MNNNVAVKLLSILGNDIRLSIFRLLIQAGKEGLNPSYIAQKLDIKSNKLSFHLNGLKKANLVNCEKNGRELIYSTNYKIIGGLVDFLFENCCNGDNSTCLDTNTKICS
jgi:ArsR family transcriptional regulator